MIPVSLVLSNFMSYETLNLDFSEFHIACLSGENGAGKSSILDAITWCIWDSSRASSNEQLVRLGRSNMSVELSFKLEDRMYKILRYVKKSKTGKTVSSSLEFQAYTGDVYKSLTGRSIRETQSKITETIKMDYETFVNSAFILQGKADKFTTKTPKERKDVLAEILNLEQYDILQNKAKDKQKEFEASKNILFSELIKQKESIIDENTVTQEIETIETKLLEVQKNLDNLDSIIENLTKDKEIYSNEIAQLSQVEKNYQDNKKYLENTQKNIDNLKKEFDKIEKIVLKKEEIEKNYECLKNLKQEEQKLTEKQTQHYEIENKINTLTREIQKQKHELELEKHKLDERFLQYKKEENEHEKIVKDREKILNGYESLKKAKEEESEYQKKAVTAQKLSEKLHKLEKDYIDELNKIKNKQSQINSQILEREKLIKSFAILDKKLNEINEEIKKLDYLKIRLEFIREEGLKIKSKIEYNTKSIADKKTEIELYENKIKDWQGVHGAECPMCHTFLTELDKQKIIEKYKSDIDVLTNEIDDLTLNNTKDQKLVDEYREEYKKISSELKKKDNLQLELGQVNHQLETIEKAKKELEELEKISLELKNKIKNNEISENLQNEIKKIKKQILELEYNHEKLSTLQANVNNWSWAELKYSQLEQSQSRLNSIREKIPSLEKELLDLKTNLEKELYAKEKIDELEKSKQKIEALDYKKEEHQKLREKITSLNIHEKDWQDLQKAITKNQSLKEEITRLEISKKQLEKNINIDLKKIEKLPEFQEKFENVKNQIEEKNKIKNEIQTEKNTFSLDLAKLKDKLERYAKYKEEIEIKQKSLEKIEYEIRLYKELVKAFGKNGIQSVIIENAIPEIEHFANSLLNRITEGKMSIKFATIKSNKTNDKLSETLDIYISDELGTRNYEMYSGGESFKVNFAIRLALSKVLTRRSGVKLKTLVIDEGFGTQDSKGISRMIEVINVISSDFEKILVVTHLTELKEAFPSRIEVYKTIHGSQAKLFK